MPEAMTPEIITVRRDMTLRWPCRGGDFLMWLGFSDLFSGPEAIQCHDLWEMRDGSHLTITNRLEDLPPWFRLHPTEVFGCGCRGLGECAGVCRVWRSHNR